MGSKGHRISRVKVLSDEARVTSGRLGRSQELDFRLNELALLSATNADAFEFVVLLHRADDLSGLVPLRRP